MPSKHSEFEELLGIIGDCLESAVRPHVKDHYGQLQLQAAREALRHIGARVDFRQRDDELEVSALREAIESLAALGFSRKGHETQSPSIEDGQAQLRAELAHLIEQIYAHPDSSVRERALAPVWRVVRRQFDAEARRIRTGGLSSTPVTHAE